MDNNTSILSTRSFAPADAGQAGFSLPKNTLIHKAYPKMEHLIGLFLSKSTITDLPSFNLIHIQSLLRLPLYPCMNSFGLPEVRRFQLTCIDHVQTVVQRAQGCTAIVGAHGEFYPPGFGHFDDFLRR